jgi:dipeptidyl aminopeptidase/acylaminoacyl peptidase
MLSPVALGVLSMLSASGVAVGAMMSIYVKQLLRPSRRRARFAHRSCSSPVSGRNAFGVVVLVGAVAVIPGCGSSSSAPLRWTDETPSWSPNGSEIVFASNRAKSGSFIDHVYVMNGDGTHVLRLTHDDDDAREPSFSPDGSKIVYAWNLLDSDNQFSGKGEIWVMSANGANPHSLTSRLLTDSDQPAWSPNGRLIAFLNGGSNLYVVRPDGGGLRRLARNVNGWAFAWSPNGKTIAVSDDSHLHLIPVNTTRVINVGARSNFPIRQTTDIVWSPSGAKIAFVRGEQVYDGSGDISPRTLWIHDVRSGHERQLTQVPDSESNGAFEVTINWVPRRPPTLALLGSDYHIHLITVTDGHMGRSFPTSPGARLAAGSASPTGNSLVLVDGRPGSYLSALSVVSTDRHSYRRLTQVNH